MINDDDSWLGIFHHWLINDDVLIVIWPFGELNQHVWWFDGDFWLINTFNMDLMAMIRDF